MFSGHKAMYRLYKFKYLMARGGSVEHPPIETLQKGKCLLFATIETSEQFTSQQFTSFFSKNTIKDFSTFLAYKNRYALENKTRVNIYEVELVKDVDLIKLDVLYTPENLDSFLEKEHVISSDLWDNYSTKEAVCAKGYHGWIEHTSAEPHRKMGVEVMICVPKHFVKVRKIYKNLSDFYLERTDELRVLLGDEFSKEIIENLKKSDNTYTEQWLTMNILKLDLEI